MTHRINFKLCTSACQWKAHCMIAIYKEWAESSWVGGNSRVVDTVSIIALLNLYGWSIIASLGGPSLTRTAKA